MNENLPLSRVYCLLEPGPVVLLTTNDKGKSNMMTMSWHTMMEFDLECKVIDMELVDKYIFFILEVINAWARLWLRAKRSNFHQK